MGVSAYLTLWVHWGPSLLEKLHVYSYRQLLMNVESSFHHYNCNPHCHTWYYRWPASHLLIIIIGYCLCKLDKTLNYPHLNALVDKYISIFRYRRCHFIFFPSVLLFFHLSWKHAVLLQITVIWASNIILCLIHPSTTSLHHSLMCVADR